MTKNNTSKIFLFVGYFKQNTILKSNVFRPILTATTDWKNKPELISDNSGDNIAELNKYYGELSGHYWVWKNFLPKTDAQYIGFCHYRRFLDFNLTESVNMPFYPTLKTDFERMFKTYTEKNILNTIEDYDIVLPQKFYFGEKVYEQYVKYHPKKEMDLALYIIEELYPEYAEATKKIMDSTEMYTCMNFVMKKELFNDYAEWIFNILRTLEQRSNWSEYVEYLEIRTPAYIAERFFNVWLEHNIKTRKLKVLNTSSVLLIGDEYGNDEAKKYADEYLDLVQHLTNQEK